MTTYSNRSNAIRAARMMLKAKGIREPMSGVHFKLAAEGDQWVWHEIDVKSGALAAGEEITEAEVKSVSELIAKFTAPEPYGEVPDPTMADTDPEGFTFERICLPSPTVSHGPTVLGHGLENEPMARQSRVSLREQRRIQRIKEADERNKTKPAKAERQPKAPKEPKAPRQPGELKPLSPGSVVKCEKMLELLFAKGEADEHELRAICNWGKFGYLYQHAKSKGLKVHVHRNAGQPDRYSVERLAQAA